MGEIERELPASAIAQLDQLDADAMKRLRELITVQRDINRVYGDTSPSVLAAMISGAVEDEPVEKAAHIIVSFSSIMATAVKELFDLGWPRDESLSVEG